MAVWWRIDLVKCDHDKVVMFWSSGSGEGTAAYAGRIQSLRP